MSYLGADAKTTFLAQFTGNNLYRDSDNIYGENIFVIPYNSTGHVPNELWYKVSSVDYAKMNLGPTDELNFWVNVGGQYYVKKSYLDMISYHPTAGSGVISQITTSLGDMSKYLPYILIGGGVLLLVILLKKKKSSPEAAKE
jgi:hypothetical protein